LFFAAAVVRVIAIQDFDYDSHRSFAVLSGMAFGIVLQSFKSQRKCGGVHGKTILASNILQVSLVHMKKKMQ